MRKHIQFVKFMRFARKTGFFRLGLLPVFLLGMLGNVEAQQSEVRVVKPYNPTLSGAEKIQLLPSMNEEVEFERPTFSYHLQPKLYPSQFNPEPIKAARMVKPPLKKLYKSELLLGVGNYLTPLAELNLNQLRSRKGAFGVQLRHHSMNGNVKLDNDERVPAGFGESSGRVYGDRFFKNSVLNYEAGVEYNTAIHYGIDTAEFVNVPERDSLKHNWFLAEASLKLHSAHTDSFHFNYNAGLDYYFFTHQFNEAEHGARLDFSFHKSMNAFDLAGDAGGAFYGRYPVWDSAMRSHTMVWVNPRIAKSSKAWRFTAGFGATLSVFPDNSVIHLYPQGSFEFNMVEEVIVPYFGVDGFLESNHYRKTVEENPYIVPTLLLKPSNHKLVAYLGVKGRITEKFSYKLKGSYSVIDDQYFFVNDTSQALKNQFSVVYSDITLLNVQAEFTVRPNTDWLIFLKGNYYNYTMSTMTLADGTSRPLQDDDHPWNKPAWDASLQARYNMSDKFLINMGVYTIGKRYYEDFTVDEESLPLTVDVNLGIEYRYSNLLSFWMRINNLAAQPYYHFNQYPSYRFRAMVGFTYSL